MMPRLLLEDNAFQKFRDALIRRAAAHQAAQIMLNDAKQARAKLAIRRQPKPIAVTTKWFAHGCDEPELALSLGECPSSGCFGWIVTSDRFEFKLLGEPAPH